MAIDPTTTTTVKVSELASAGYNTTDLIPHEVAGILKKGNLQDLATFIGGIISTEGAVGFRAVTVTDGQTLPATTEEEFILVGPGTYPNVGGGSAVTTTEPLNALVSNGTYWFIGVEIPIGATGVWGTISGTLDNQTDLKDVLDLKADLVDGKVPSSQLPSYVDDVVEVANYAALPSTGETGKIYLTLDNNKIYRWSGSAYIEIADNNAVWGMITGTLSDQTDLNTALNLKVPYTGATGNVDLGSHKLTASDLVVNHTSGSGTAATISKGGNGEALTVTKSSGSGNVASFAGGVTSISELHLTTDLADDYIASAATWNAKQSALNGTGFVKASGTTISYDNTTYVPTSRRLTINGTDYDLTADRSWTILSGAWGYISGTLSDQEDLQAALDLKATDASVVKITTDQNIRGIKTFLGDQTATTLKLIVADYYNDGFITSDNGMLRLLNGTTELFNLASTGDLTAKSFVKTGGTASQFLKANGTVDSTTYLSGTVAIANGGTGATTADSALSNLGGTTVGKNIFTSTNPSPVTTAYLKVKPDNSVEWLEANAFRIAIGAGTGNGTVTSVEAVGSYGGLTLTGTVTGSGQITLGGTPEGTWPINITGNASSVNTVQVSTNADFYLTFADANNGSPTSEFLYTIGSVKVNPSTGALTAGSFVKSGGTSSQYLMADGSVSTGGGVSGTGTTNYIPKFTGASAIGNSLIFDNGTNVGIGTTSPRTPLEVFGNGLILSYSTSNAAARDYLIATNYNAFGDFVINQANANGGNPYSAGTTRFAINAAGNVGIGTTSPSSLLHLYVPTGTLYQTLESNVINQTVGTITKTPSKSFFTGQNYSVVNNWEVYDITSSASRLSISPSGNVGIGTSSPDSKLHVTGNIKVGNALDNSSQWIGKSSTGTENFRGAIKFTSTTTDDIIQFNTHRSGVSSDIRMTIDGIGNVGIGTTSPAQKLDVHSVIRATNTSSAAFQNAALELFTYNGSSVSAGTSLFSTNSNFNYGTIVSNQTNLYGVRDGGIRIATGVAPIVFSNGNADIDFASERMRITSGGNVGIGTASPLTALTVSGNLSLFTTNQIRLYNSAKNNWAEMSSPLLGGDTEIDFKLVTKSGIVYVNPAGNVGIGTTSPDRKLTVNSDLPIRLEANSNPSGYYTLLGTNYDYDKSFLINNKGDEILTYSQNEVLGLSLSNPRAGNIRFSTNGLERMRITSGGLVEINRTADLGNGFLEVNGSASRSALACNQVSTSSSPQIYFSNPNGIVGSITSSGSSTGYFTSSDYRLKTDLKSFNGLDLVSQIKVYDYEWKIDNTRSFGVMAHELQEILPQAVTGEKDAEQMQSVDYSKLVPILVASIQELKAEIELLKSKL